MDGFQSACGYWAFTPQCPDWVPWVLSGHPLFGTFTTTSQVPTKIQIQYTCKMGLKWALCRKTSIKCHKATTTVPLAVCRVLSLHWNNHSNKVQFLNGDTYLGSLTSEQKKNPCQQMDSGICIFGANAIPATVLQASALVLWPWGTNCFILAWPVLSVFHHCDMWLSTSFSTLDINTSMSRLILLGTVTLSSCWNFHPRSQIAVSSCYNLHGFIILQALTSNMPPNELRV